MDEKKNKALSFSIYLLSLLLISCSIEKKIESPRIKSYLKIVSPNSNEIIKRNDSIRINIISDSKEKSIKRIDFIIE